MDSAKYVLELPHRLRGDTDNNPGRAMIGITGCTKAPVDIVIECRAMDWCVTFVGIAKTSTTAALPTAVVVRDHVVLTICRIAARANPSNR